MTLRANYNTSFYEFSKGGPAPRRSHTKKSTRFSNNKKTKSSAVAPLKNMYSDPFKSADPKSKKASWGGYNVPPAYPKPSIGLVDQDLKRREKLNRQFQSKNISNIKSNVSRSRPRDKRHGQRGINKAFLFNTIELEESFDGRLEDDSYFDSEEEKVCPALPLPKFINEILLQRRNRNKMFLESVTEQIKKEEDMRKIYDTRKETQKTGEIIRELWVGDVGLTLFLPLDRQAFEPLEKKPIVKNTDFIITDPSVFYKKQYEPEHNDEKIDDTDSSDDMDSDEEVFIEYEADLENSPRILNEEQLKRIQSKALPPSVALMTWTRAYSLRRDGDDFQTMINNCSNYQNTLTVIKTKDGDILGGFANATWGKQRHSPLSQTRSFYGGGQCFLFANRPYLGGSPEETKEGKIRFYRWTGDNNYNQVCDVDKGGMGMGGGGNFAWFVEQDFSVGSTGRCSTFDNHPLSKGQDGRFDILDFEVYGFKNMSHRLCDITHTTSFATDSSVASLSSIWE